MKRGLIETLGIAGATAVMTLFVTAFDPAAAQESDVRLVQGARFSQLSVIVGSGSYLGVEITDVDEEVMDEAGLSAEYGVYVASVVEDGPAAEAGLQDGDVLVRWNGERLESVAQLQRLMGETPAGRTVSIGVIRDGASRDYSVELGDHASGDLRVFTVPRDRPQILRERLGGLGAQIRERLQVAPRIAFNVRTFLGRPRLGVSIQSLGEQLADYFGVEGGALVTEVREDSPAANAGIMAGDVIVEIGGESVEDPGDLREALADREAGSVEVQVVRDGSRRSFTVELEESQNRWEPFSFEGLEVGPIEFDGFDMEPMEWRIEIPGFELPGLELPGLESTSRRIEIAHSPPM